MAGFFENIVLIPESEYGVARVKHVVVDEHDSRMSAIRGGTSYIPKGTYMQLWVKNEMFMSNTRFEKIANTKVVMMAKGDVLIFGLGLGMILPEILAKKEVTSVTVVELYSDVVQLIEPHFQHPKLSIIQGDAFTFKPHQWNKRIPEKYDTIWFNIWSDYNTELLPEMGKLLRRARRWKKDASSKADCWLRSHLLSEKRREKGMSGDDGKRIRT